MAENGREFLVAGHVLKKSVHDQTSATNGFLYEWGHTLGKSNLLTMTIGKYDEARQVIR